MTDRPSPEALAGVTARAFGDETLMRHVFPAAHGRVRRILRLHRPMIRASLHNGGVETDGDGSAVAAWLPGAAVPLPLGSMLRAGMGLVPLVTPPIALRRLLRHDGEVEHALAERFRHQPFGYLWTVGVEPARQGEGLGARVVRKVLASMSRFAPRCVLKTEDEGNVAFYRRLGFEVDSTRVVKASGLRTWIMARPSGETR